MRLWRYDSSQFVCRNDSALQVDCSTWFDMSDEVNDTLQHIEGTPQQDIYVGRYVAMLRGTHDMIARNLPGQPSMLYVSTDRMWTASPWCPGELHSKMRIRFRTGGVTLFWAFASYWAAPI